MSRPLLPWLVLASIFSVLPAHAQDNADLDLLVGTYTQGDSQGLYRMGFNSQTGLIDTQPRQVVVSENPSWLTLSRKAGYLFVVNENGPGQADTQGKVSSYAIDPQTHELRLINQVASQSDEPTHSSLTPDQRYLLVANYAVQAKPGGALAVLPVDSAGRLGDAVQVLGPNPPSKVNAERQSSSHVHGVLPTPDNKYVVAADLGADKLFVYQYDAQLGQPLQPFKAATVSLPKGSGPRHLLFSDNGKHAWLTLEMTAQVAVFDYHNGRFRQTQLVDLKQPGKHQAVGASGLHASADGRFLYVANRGDANELLVFSIDPASGALKELQRRSVQGREPREFSIDPSGRFLLIANQKSNQIVTLKRDPQSGRLGDVVQALDMPAPSALLFLPSAQ